MKNGKRILVTGGSGKAGAWVVRDLLERGYDVTNVDLQPSKEIRTYRVDLTDLGQTTGLVAGKDAILHLAAIPWAGEHAPEVVFRNNVMSTFNILQAAALLGVKKVVLTGSESVLGFPFAFQPITPRYLPIDEAHPSLAQDAYGLSKMMVEELGRGFVRRDPSLSVTTLHLSYVLRPEDYVRELRSAWSDTGNNAFNLWCYVDARDVASAFRLALEYPEPGYDAFYIAAPDTLMREPTLDLIAQHFPGVERIEPGFGERMAPLTTRHASEVLGFEAQYTWEIVVKPDDVLTGGA
jgi:nucleoside-diphosphate-sugar epimerase